jgi:hypothetical protein
MLPRHWEVRYRDGRVAQSTIPKSESVGQAKQRDGRLQES